MEIRDPIHGPIGVSELELRLVDAFPYQRLRRIKQLGFGELSFPGGTHNRYLHSLGTMHLAGRAFDVICRSGTLPDALTLSERERFRKIVRLGALLHDVGHAPLSHSTEVLMPPRAALNLPFAGGERQASHEDYSLKLILESEIGQILDSQQHLTTIAPSHVAALISDDVPADGVFTVGGVNYRPLCSALISGELDADRMDYLIRDAFFTGVSYGRFDREWLMSNLIAHLRDGKAYLGVDSQAVFSIDDFLLSRYHMFVMVYNHHKVIAYDEMLRRLFEGSGRPIDALPASVDDYLALDDYKLYHMLNESSDEWAQRIVRRRPFRKIFEQHRGHQQQDFAEIRERLQLAGIPCLETTSRSAISKYFTGGAGSTNVFVRILDRPGRPEYIPLEQYSELFSKYGTGTEINRLYVAPERYDDARRALEQ